MGSIFHIKLFHLKNILSFISDARKKNVNFFSTNVSQGKSYFQVKYTFPCVLVVGNEGHGISEDIISLSDSILNIPIYGNSESLNVGVATGIILYEMARHKYDI
jgi:TrmH family RNA methyltransferase